MQLAGHEWEHRRPVLPTTAAIFRRLATSLPSAYESAHMGHPDFRVATPDGKGRIFATLSAEASGKGVLKLTPEQQQSFLEDLPELFEPVQGGWGRAGMTYVHLDRAEEALLLGALTTAHRNVVARLEAPKPTSQPRLKPSLKHSLKPSLKPAKKLPTRRPK